MKIKELIDRPIIRNDQVHEFMNKMTDQELIEYEKEIEQILLEENQEKIFPDWNAAFLAKIIDTEIFYQVLKMNKQWIQ